MLRSSATGRKSLSFSSSTCFLNDFSTHFFITKKTPLLSNKLVFQECNCAWQQPQEDIGFLDTCKADRMNEMVEFLREGSLVKFLKGSRDRVARFLNWLKDSSLLALKNQYFVNWIHCLWWCVCKPRKCTQQQKKKWRGEENSSGLIFNQAALLTYPNPVRATL